jgi:hypothetical protein
MEFTRLPHIIWLRRLAWGVTACMALGLLAWLGLPPLLKYQAERRGSEALGRALTIGAVEFKPWTLELTLSNIQIASADGKATQLSVTRAYVDGSIQSLWRLAPVVDAITIEQPHLALTHLGAGHYDIDDVLERLKPAPDAQPSTPLRFALYNLAIKDGSADFVDHRGGRERNHSLRQLNASLPFLSNFDSQREVTMQPHLAFTLNGSAFESSAQATPFAADRKGDVNLQVTHLDLAPYLPYLPASLPVRLQAAVLDSSLKLSFAQSKTNTLVLSGAIKVSGIKMGDRAGTPLLSASSLQLVLKELRPLEQSVALESLDINSPNLWVSRNRAGQWSLPGMAEKMPVTPAASPAAPQSSQAAGQVAAAAPGGWQVLAERIKLQGGQVRFSDESMASPVKLSLIDTRIELRDVHWPLAKPVHLDATARLQAPDAKGGKVATIQLTGAGTDAAGTVTARLTDMGLPLAAPYLAQVLQPQASGVLEGELAVNWKDGAVQVQAKRLALHDFALTPPVGKTGIAAKELPAFKLLEASDVAVDLQKRSASVGKLALRSPRVRVSRADDGQWLAAQWLMPSQPPTSTQAAPAAVPAKPNAVPWSVALADLAVDDGTLTWVDRVPSKTVFLELSTLQAHLTNLTLDGKKPVPLTLSAKVRSVRTDPGSLRFDGTLMWDPLVAQGTLEAKQFPAQSVAPYAMGNLRLDVLRADTSFKGQLRYASLPAGPDVQLRGDGAIEELVVNSLSARAGAPAARAPVVDLAVSRTVAASMAPTAEAVVSEELLNWKALSVPGIEFSMAPGVPVHLKLRELSLSDFFARLIVNAQGRLVLQNLVNPEDDEATAPAGLAAANASASAPQAGASAPAPARASPNDPVIEIGTIRLVNGRVAYSDRFIKPNYSANLTELAGSLSHFSSRNPEGGVQMADLELRGRAEGTASLEIAGKLNPLAKPLALDIHAKVRDLELSPLSSYAIKYAGYGIERGKLSVDLHYSVSPDGQLQASNQITLNQLVFGDAVEGATNSLPVKLAVALLADSNGVIDLNVPVSGSLNDPQFRIWPIVWKVVGNIIAQALTSPFKLIGGLLGGEGAADELSNVAFDTGTSRISAAGLQGLDQVAQALRDKPSLRLTVVGTASLEREAGAIKRERLEGLLLAEKRRAAATAGKDVTAVAEVTAQETPALLQEVYRRSGVKKPRNIVGLIKDLPAADMEALLLDSMAVDGDTARELALNRSIAVREYLTARQLPSERLFLGELKTDTPAADWQPRAELSIEHH